ncbi:zinc finger domain-containing protein tiptop isoform X2 [Rhynchophorus ferrugineus]|uniref:zinc finger domain-containing protein tiptop isoform X2 n=1 Tax=Rhynchophorus ferrugineus TaxID=354439 RepID=UPI003FCE5365
MTRRKQDCPKRMKWEGGEDGSPDEGEKLEGEEDAGSATPTSTSPTPAEEDAQSPQAGDVPSPTSPRSVNDDSTLIRESTSRCNSRDSSESQTLPRCPSGESERMLAERAALLQGVPLGASLSPVGVALPPSIPAALLPPQSAAMAAYLNAAAAAAVQSHRLMMTSPLPGGFTRAPVSPLISASSPPGILNSSAAADLSQNMAEGILDFSRRNKSEDSESDSVSLRKSETPPSGESGNGPLDLSVSSRKRTSEEPLPQPPQRKPKMDFKPTIPQWPPGLGAQHLPYFAAAVAAAGLSPKNNPAELWNGKLKHSTPAPSDATKALEKMSELSKLGGDDIFRTMANAVPGNSSSNRHSAWQSHWLNKGAEQAKDVLKCVWCKQSFPSLAALTTHMKEAKHCGVNVPVPPMQSNNLPSQSPMTSPSNTNSNASSLSGGKPNQSDLNMLIKETMPLPRKLVRGQDVWLGKGAEQTRQILKCMWCGQSFRSLAEMTSHMQETQHYTNIISQEQIISWRSSDEGKGGGGSGPNNQTPPGSTSSHVSAVLTCKVCDQAFSSLKELSNHMVKNSHYKEHIMRSITESGGRRRQTREKRKKSLPVRKLLELERAQHEFKNGDSSTILDKMRDPTGAGRITCEKCGNKIETTMFVDHIRQCVGGMTSNQRNFLKSALMSNNILPPESPDRNKMKTPSDQSPSPQQRSPSVSDMSNKESNPPAETNNGSSPSVLNAIEKLIEKSFDSRTRQNPGYAGHGHTQAPMGSSILKRLGIDESVDYTKPLVDAQTMSLLRSYHQQQSHYARRERSGSESSSMSERGSSRVDSLTPERKMEPPGAPLSSTPRSTPDIKREKSPFGDKTPGGNDSEPVEAPVTIKKEVDDDEHRSSENQAPVEVKIKKEKEDDNEDDERQSFHSNGDVSKEDDDKRRSHTASPQVAAVEPSQPTSPCRNSTSSPASSDRSGTPRSTNSDRKSAGGSLGALSSMFDNLSGANNSGEGPASGGGKKGSSHPLAALQKLCDKTETHTNNRSHPATVTSANVASSTPSAAGTTPGAILAFSWACNDAVMTPDSIMKCAFCDTPFISKGAYRHHLSKMHFVKDGVIPDPITVKATGQNASSGGGANVGVPLKGTAVLPGSSASSAAPKSPPTAGGFEESPHSKFLKYTELAKQLSSKYV